MKRISVVTLVMFCVTGMAKSQTNEEFKPGGKPFMKIFSNYHTTFSGGESASAFELTRVYLGYDYQFSKKFSAKANIDVGNPGNGSFEMTAYVKNAYIRYEEDKLAVYFGLIPTNQFNLQEKAWGNRYIAKSFQDAYKFNSSADLGMSIDYKFSDVVSADFILANGEGYKKLQSDSTLRAGFGVTVKPVKQLTGRVYYDFSTKDGTTLSSLALFLGYTTKKFSLGAEYNMQKNYGFTDGKDMDGVSCYTSVRASKKIKFIGRYDHIGSCTLPGASSAWNLSSDGELYLVGLEFSPVEGVKIAPNFQGWNPRDGNQSFSSTAILNCEIKF